jgi:hypothetical protein
MRTYSFNLAEGNPQRLLTITRLDETVIRVCTWAQPITIGADTWLPVKGLKLSDMSERVDGSPSQSSFDVAWEIGGLFDPIEIADHMFENALVLIEITNANNPTTRDFDFYGRVGECMLSTVGLATFELRSPFSFDREILVPKYTLPCRHDFGNRFCQMPLLRPLIQRSTAYPVLGTARRFRFDSAGNAEDFRNRYLEVTVAGTTAGTAPAFSSTLGATTVDGGVTWTTRDSLERAVRIASIVNRHTVTIDRHPVAGDVNDYFSPGGLYMDSGRNKGKRFHIGTYVQATLRVSCRDPIGICSQVGDYAFIWKDCDKTLEMCDAAFHNAANYGGFRHFEGAKAASAIQS